MRKFAIILLLTIWFYLCMAVIVKAQTKPASPVLQSGWSTNCVRAIPLHEGSGTTPTDLTGNSTPSISNAAAWASDAEGAYFDSNSGSYNIDFDTGLPGASVSNYTVYIRVIEFASGATGPYYSTFSGGLANSDVQIARDPSTDRRINFAVQNATNCATCLGSIDVTISPNTKYNVIAEYDGDSLRTWINNARNCAVKLTNGGNILNSGYTSRIAHGHNQVVNGCQGSSSMFGTIKLYTVVIWRRLLTPTERAQIQSNPYVMYEAAAAGGRRNVIIIQSMLPNIDSLLYLIIYLSLVGIAAGIYKIAWQEAKIKSAWRKFRKTK